jgi:hypothetical protein
MNKEIRWIRAIEATSAAFQTVDALSGGAGDDIGNAAILSCRADLAHVIKKLNNLALMCGCSPAALKTARNLNEA